MRSEELVQVGVGGEEDVALAVGRACRVHVPQRIPRVDQPPGEALVERLLLPGAARVEDVAMVVVAATLASARSNSRTTRPRPAGTSAAARASMPIVWGGEVLMLTGG